MGLLDRMKKPESQPVSDAADESRRFTLLVEEVFQLQDDQGVVAAGILYGAVQKEDSVYIIHPAGNITLARVDGIEIGQGQAAERAVNQKAAIRLSGIKDKNQIPKFTVLTSIKPQTTVDVNTAAENPQLLGLSMEYRRYCEDMTYLNLFIYVLVHAHYVVPVSMDREPKNNGDGTSTFQKESRVRFPALQDPNDKSKSVFPVFTDWVAMANWKNVFDEKHPPRSMIVRFPDAVSICKGNGIVVNPFGPTPVMLSAKTISQIVNMEGYQKEFVEKATDNVQRVKMDKESKIWVGVPKDNDEVNMIKDVLVTYAKQVKAIKRVDLLLKFNEKKEQAYLCVVDCPEEQATVYFSEIHKAAAPYFNEIKCMEFLIYGKSKMALEAVSENSCIYRSGQ